MGVGSISCLLACFIGLVACHESPSSGSDTGKPDGAGDATTGEVGDTGPAETVDTRTPDVPEETSAEVDTEVPEDIAVEVDEEVGPDTIEPDTIEPDTIDTAVPEDTDVPEETVATDADVPEDTTEGDTEVGEIAEDTTPEVDDTVEADGTDSGDDTVDVGEDGADTDPMDTEDGAGEETDVVVTCEDGQYRAGNLCLTCAPVVGCNGEVLCSGPDDSACDACEEGSFLAGGVCFRCAPVLGCAGEVTCSNAGDSHCGACAPGRYELEGYCLQCAPIPGCAEQINCTDGSDSTCGACPPGTIGPSCDPIACVPSSQEGSPLVISAVFDGPLGGYPKVVELFARRAVGNLVGYGIGTANNGGGSDGSELQFPPGISIAAGDVLYVVTDAAAFQAYFGFAADIEAGRAVEANGDDAIELFLDHQLVDVFGDVNQDGTDTAWDYTDGWAYRRDGEGPNAVFTIGEWEFSGIDVTDGCQTHATCPAKLPLASYLGDDTTCGPECEVSGECEFDACFANPCTATDARCFDLADATFGTGAAGRRCDGPFDDLVGTQGAALRAALLERIDNHVAYGYDFPGYARQLLMAVIEPSDDGRLECVYSGRTVLAEDPNAPPVGDDHSLPNVDTTPQRDCKMANQTAILCAFNTEHSWPQSLGADEEPMRSDMHHLFPSDDGVNIQRSNRPYGDTTCAAAGCPWSEGGSERGTRSDGASVFEVRLAKRGDVARAQFYFAVRYGMAIDPAQEATLRAWHTQDPVDARERQRNERVRFYQGNRNPFVDLPELVGAISDF